MLHALILAAAGASAPAASSSPKPVRSMVYEFNYTTGTDKVQHSGTIHADVLGITTDGGLAIRFSEETPGDPSLTFAPAECSVYGDTRVQCSKAGALSTFENELAHLLGRNFVDGNAMDEKNHWRVAGTIDGNKVTDDYTVHSNDNGILNITETRDVTQKGETTHHTATITYDLNKTIPTKVVFTDSAASNPQMNLTATYTLRSDWIVPAPSPKPKP